MSKSTKIHPHDFDDDYEEEDVETPAEIKKRQKLQERRNAKFDKIWDQEDIIS
jgi:hypothetical protein